MWIILIRIETMKTVERYWLLSEEKVEGIALIYMYDKNRLSQGCS
jgi:hypothetical protein